MEFLHRVEAIGVNGLHSVVVVPSIDRTRHVVRRRESCLS
jgi:hypothetical protein